MWKLLQIELFKIFKRPRTYISFAAVAALVSVIQFGLKVDGKTYVDFMLRDLAMSFNIEGNVLNGYLVCYIILQLLLVHVPLLITLIAADLISGEANMGTLRLLLTKPVSRTEVVLAKFFGALFFYVILWIPTLVYFWIFQILTHQPAANAVGAIWGSYLMLLLLGMRQVVQAVPLSTSCVGAAASTFQPLVALREIALPSIETFA